MVSDIKMGKKEMKRFNDIWWRAGGFTLAGAVVRLAERKYRRGETRKYPNRRERRWWNAVGERE